MILVYKSRLIAVLVGILLASYAPAATIWNEATQGDLADEGSAPTSLVLTPGSNDLFAVTQGGDLEFVTVTVPPGSSMTSLFLRSYSGFDATAFLGMQRGSTFTESPFFPNVANLLGYSHFGPGAGNVGADFLPAIGMGFGAQGFTPPLPADSYTLWLQQLGSAATYQLDFVVSAPQPPTWNVDADGNWSQASNWSGGVPNAAAVEATFGSVIKAPRTVTVDAPITVGRIEFDNANAYTIAGTNTLMLDVTSGEAQINILSGSHTINAPLTLADNTTIAITPAAANLAITGALNAGGRNVNKAGAGTLTVNNVRAAALSVNGGAVTVAPDGGNDGASVVSALSLAGATDAWTAKLDLTNNDAVLHSGGANKPADFARLHNQVKQGFNNGDWKGLGITSATAAANTNTDTGISVVDNALLGYSNFSGQPVTADSILLKYTYYGDIDMNGQVDADDLTVFASNFGRASGATQVDGDIDFNGAVNADDLTVFANNFNKGVGTPLGVAGVQAVPEPGTWILATSALIAVVLLAVRHQSGLPAWCTVSLPNSRT